MLIKPGNPTRRNRVVWLPGIDDLSLVRSNWWMVVLFRFGGLYILVAAICSVSEGSEEAWNFIHGHEDEIPEAVASQPWDEVYESLTSRDWKPAEEAGEIHSHTHRLSNGHEATFFYYVPESYGAAIAAPVAIYLHGGVTSPEPKRGKPGIDNWMPWADATGGIVIAPSATSENMWWAPAGEEHVIEALRYVSERYHVDRKCCSERLFGWRNGDLFPRDAVSRFMGGLHSMEWGIASLSESTCCERHFLYPELCEYLMAGSSRGDG